MLFPFSVVMFNRVFGFNFDAIDLARIIICSALAGFLFPILFVFRC